MSLKKTAHQVVTAARSVLLGIVMTAAAALSSSASPADRPLDYRIVATSATSTMERQLNEAGSDGYRFSKATGGVSANGGPEVIVAMVRDTADRRVWKYKLLAASKTATMQKELRESGAQGYALVGLSVGKTAFGGDEVIAILRKD